MIQIRIIYLNETVFYITFTSLYHVPFLRKSITCDLLCDVCFILECYKPKLITPRMFYCISKTPDSIKIQLVVSEKGHADFQTWSLHYTFKY